MLIRGKVLTGADHSDVSSLSAKYREEINEQRRKHAPGSEAFRAPKPKPGTARLPRKGTNRFKFQSISKLMNQTQIDLRTRPLGSSSIHLTAQVGRHKRQSHDSLQDTQLASYFAQALEYWRELDRSTGFRDFFKSVVDQSKNLLQVIHHKDHIISSLLAKLAGSDVVSYKSYLDLLCLVALDLQDEFYHPYFGKSLTVLVGLVDSTPPQLSEQIFSTIIFLFKFSLGNLLQESMKTFEEFYIPLLSHPRDFVRRFSADTFAYLARRLRKTDRLTALVRNLLRYEHAQKALSLESAARSHGGLERFQDGLSHLLASTVKGVKHRFHSSLAAVLAALLDCVSHVRASGHTDDGSGASWETVILEQEHRRAVFHGFLRRVCNYTRLGAEKSDSVYLPLLQRALDCSELPASAGAAGLREQELVLQNLLSSVRLWVEFRQGSRVSDVAPLLQLLEALLLHRGSPAHRMSGILRETLELLLASWRLLVRVGEEARALKLLSGATARVNSENWIPLFDVIGRLVRRQQTDELGPDPQHELSPEEETEGEEDESEDDDPEDKEEKKSGARARQKSDRRRTPASTASSAMTQKIQEQLRKRSSKKASARRSPQTRTPVANGAREHPGRLSERLCLEVFQAVEAGFPRKDPESKDLLLALLLQIHDPVPILLTAPSAEPREALDFQSQQTRTHFGRFTEQHPSPIELASCLPAVHAGVTPSVSVIKDPIESELAVLHALRASSSQTSPTERGRESSLWLDDLLRRRLLAGSDLRNLRKHVIQSIRAVLAALESMGSPAPRVPLELIPRLWLQFRLLPILGASSEEKDLFETSLQLRSRLAQILKDAYQHPTTAVMMENSHALRDVILVRSQLEIALTLLICHPLGDVSGTKRKDSQDLQLRQLQSLWDIHFENLEWHFDHWRLSNSLPIALDPPHSDPADGSSSSSSSSSTAMASSTPSAFGMTVAETVQLGDSSAAATAVAVAESHRLVRKLWCIESGGRPCAGCTFCGSHTPHQQPIPVIVSSLAFFHSLRMLQASSLPTSLFRKSRKQLGREAPSDGDGSGKRKKKKQKKQSSDRFDLEDSMEMASSDGSPCLLWISREAFSPENSLRILKLLSFSVQTPSQLARTLVLDLLLLFPDPKPEQSSLPAAEAKDSRAAEEEEEERDRDEMDSDNGGQRSDRVYFVRDLLILMARLVETPANLAHERDILMILDSLRVFVPKFMTWNKPQLLADNVTGAAALIIHRLLPGVLLSTLRLRCTSVWPSVRLCILDLVSCASESAVEVTKHRKKQQRMTPGHGPGSEAMEDDDSDGDTDSGSDAEDLGDSVDVGGSHADVVPYVGVWEVFWNTLTLTMEQSRVLTILPNASVGMDGDSELFLSPEEEEEEEEESGDAESTTGTEGSESEEEDLPLRSSSVAFQFRDIGFRFQQWRWSWNSSTDAHTFSSQLWECLATPDAEDADSSGSRGSKRSGRKTAARVWRQLSQALHQNQMQSVLELVLHFIHFEYEVVRPPQFGTSLALEGLGSRNHRSRSSGGRGGDEDLNHGSLTLGRGGETDCCCPQTLVYHGTVQDGILRRSTTAFRPISTRGLGQLPCHEKLASLVTRTHHFPHSHALAKGSRTLVQQRCLLMLRALYRNFLHSPPSPPQYKTLAQQHSEEEEEEEGDAPAFKASSLLLPTLFGLLISSDEDLQSQVLECITCWKPPFLLPFLDRVRRLVSESTFRSEMTTFHLHPEYSQDVEIPAEHRSALARVLIRVLYSKLVKWRTTRAKTTLKGRRAAIMAYLAGLRGHELLHLFEIMLQPFTAQLSAAARLPSFRPTDGFREQNRMLREIHHILGLFDHTNVPPGFQCYDPRLPLSLLVGLSESDQKLALQIREHRIRGGVSVSDAWRRSLQSFGGAVGKVSNRLLWEPFPAVLCPQLASVVGTSVPPHPYLVSLPTLDDSELVVALQQRQGASLLGSALASSFPQLSPLSSAVLSRVLGSLSSTEPGLQIQGLPLWIRGMDTGIPERVQLSFLHMQEHMVRQLRFVVRDYFPILFTLNLRLLYTSSVFHLFLDRIRRLTEDDRVRLQELQGAVMEAAQEQDPNPLIRLLARDHQSLELLWSLPVTEPQLLRSLQDRNQIEHQKQIRQLALRRIMDLLGCMSKLGDVMQQKRNQLQSAAEDVIGESLGRQYLSMVLYLLQTPPKLPSASSEPLLPVHQLGCLHIPGTLGYRALLELLLSLTEDPDYLQLLFFSPASGSNTGGVEVLGVSPRSGSVSRLQLESEDEQLTRLRSGAAEQGPRLSDIVLPSLFAAIEAPHLRTDGDGKGDVIALQIAERLLHVEEVCGPDPQLRAALEACWTRHAAVFVQHVSARLQRVLERSKAVSQNPAAFGVSRHALAQETSFPGWELYLLAKAAPYVRDAAASTQLLRSLVPLFSHKALLGSQSTPFRTNMPLREDLQEGISVAMQKRESTRQSLFQLAVSLLPHLDGPKPPTEDGPDDSSTPGSPSHRVGLQCLEAFSRQFLLLRPSDALKSRVLLTECLLQLSELEGFRHLRQVFQILKDMNAITRDGLEEVPDFDLRSTAFRRLLSAECLGSLRVSVGTERKPPESPVWVPELGEDSSSSGFWTESHLIPISYQLLGDLHHRELSIRAQATSALRQMLQVLSIVDELARAEQHRKSSSPATAAAAAAAAEEEEEEEEALPRTKHFFSRVLDSVIHSNLKSMLRHRSEDVRREAVQGLAALYRAFPARFPAEQALLNDEEPEKDFFASIYDIQRHRRLKCLVRLRRLCEKQLRYSAKLARVRRQEGLDSHPLGVETETTTTTTTTADEGSVQESEEEPAARLLSSNLVSGVLLPLVLHFLTETETSSDGAQALLDATAQAIGALSAHLSWGAWKTTLNNLIKLLGKSGLGVGRQKWIVRSLCAALHEGFPVRALERMQREAAAEEEEEEEASSSPGHPSAVRPRSIHPTTNPASELPGFVMEYLSRKVLPDLYRLLSTKKSGGSVLQERARTELQDTGNVFLIAKGRSGSRSLSKREEARQAALEVCERLPVAMAIVKVLVRLPHPVFRRQFPKLILILANYLKSKTQTLRDDTRKILVTLTLFVGPQHWPIIFRQLRSTLSRGYQKFVAIYTIFTLLRSVHDRIIEHRELYPVRGGVEESKPEGIQTGGLFQGSSRQAEALIFDAAADAAGTDAGAASEGEKKKDPGSSQGQEMEMEMAVGVSPAEETEPLQTESGEFIFREGCLDSSLPDILQALCLHLSPDVRVERRHLARSTSSTMLREAKRDCLPDCWFHLTATIGFRSQISRLLSPLVEHLSLNCHTLKDVQHVSEILRRVGMGIQQNWSMEATDLLDFLHHALQVSMFGNRRDGHHRRRDHHRGTAVKQDRQHGRGGLEAPDLEDDADTELRSLNRIRYSKATGKQRGMAAKMALAEEDSLEEEGEEGDDRLLLSWPPELHDASGRRRRPTQVSEPSVVSEDSDVEMDLSLEEDLDTDLDLSQDEDVSTTEDEDDDEDDRMDLATQTGLSDALDTVADVRAHRRAHLYKSRLTQSKTEAFMIQKLPSSKPRVSRQVQSNTLAEFVLGILHTWLRKGSSAVPIPVLAEMLDPFFPILSRQCVGLKPHRLPEQTPQTGPSSRQMTQPKDAALTKPAAAGAAGGGEGPTKKKGEKEKKTGKTVARDPQVASEQKLRALSSDMTELALRCLPFLIRIHEHLPSCRRQPSPITGLASHCFFLLQSGQESVQQASFKTLAAILRHVRKFTLTPGRAKVLLSLAQQAVNSHNVREQAVGFTLLRAVIQRRVLLPQVYDLATRLAEMMIKAQQEVIQKQSSGVFLTFLLDYPLGPQRVRQQFEHLMQSLQYPRASGRRSLLRFLELLFSRLPEDLLQQHADLFFYPLVQNLANDVDRECRRHTAEVLGLLLRSLNAPEIRDRYLQRLYLWLSPPGDTPGSPSRTQEQRTQLAALQECAALVLGVFITEFAAESQSFQQKHAPLIVHHLFTLLRELLLRQQRLQSRFAIQNDDGVAPAPEDHHHHHHHRLLTSSTTSASDPDTASDSESSSETGDDDGEMEITSEDESESEPEITPVSTDPWDSAAEDSGETLAEDHWKLSYHALLAVEKLAEHLPLEQFNRIMSQEIIDGSQTPEAAGSEPDSSSHGSSGHGRRRRNRKRKAPASRVSVFQQAGKRARGLAGLATDTGGRLREEDFGTPWTGVCRLLLHEHTWIRMVSSRIIGQYFSRQLQLEDIDASLGASLLTRGQGLLWQETTPVTPQITLDQLRRTPGVLDSPSPAAAAAASSSSGASAQPRPTVGGKRRPPTLDCPDEDHGEGKEEEEEEEEKDDSWQYHPVFQLARTFCRQLSAEALDPKLADQIIRNLLFCLAVMHRSSGLFTLRSYTEASPSAERSRRTLLERKEQELRAAVPDQDSQPKQKQKQKQKKKKRRRMTSAPGEGVEAIQRILDDTAEDRVSFRFSPGGLWIFTRLSFLAREPSGGLFRKDCIFRLFAAAATVLDSADLRTYLLPMLHALYRVSESPPLNNTPEAAEVKDLALQTIDVLWKHSSGADFTAALSHVRRVVTEIRAARKRSRQQAAVVDPVRHARRKLAQTRRKRERRKLQSQAEKIRRQDGVAALGPSVVPRTGPRVFLQR